MKRMQFALLTIMLLVVATNAVFAEVDPVWPEPFEVTFNVDLNCAAFNGDFNRTTDQVVVTGNYPELGDMSGYVVLAEYEESGLFSGLVQIEELYIGEELEYKYGIVHDNTVYWDDTLYTYTPIGSEPDNDNNGYFELTLPLVTYGGEALCENLTLFVTPGCWPVIGAQGGYILINASVEHSYPAPVTVDIWTEVEMPNGNTKTLDAWTLTVPPNTLFERQYARYVPPNAPEGDYIFHMYAGVQPETVMSADGFGFVKEAPTTPAADSDGDLVSANLPTEFGIGSVYPNPFNPTTTVAVNLPETAQLNVSVYNVQGQLVETLADGFTNAGSHNLVFNGANLPSGLYLVRATVPGQMDEVRRVTLLK
ncbi:T9SS type A sorting domain-containing protein [bacterium]|nr:T9SS type A sorting domain-containing protein [bacterium]